MEASSKYLATKTFESLNVLFEASQEIQDWLTECADMIAGCGENVIKACKIESISRYTPEEDVVHLGALHHLLPLLIASQQLEIFKGFLHPPFVDHDVKPGSE